MLYINKLTDLNQKSAEIASVQILRELKKKIKLPLEEETFSVMIENATLSETDKQSINNASLMIDDLIEKLSLLLEQIALVDEKKTYEPLNIKRGIEMLLKLKSPLEKNLAYGIEVERMKMSLMREFIFSINVLYDKKGYDKLKDINDMLNRTFKIILRSENLTFNSDKIIGEGEIKTINSILESVNKGFLFHFSLSDEVKKISFQEMKFRLSEEDIKRNEELSHKLYLIKDGVERVYDHNMRMIMLALNMYAILNWANNG